MLRLFVIFTLLFLNLYACKDGYGACKKKINDSLTFSKNTIAIPVKKYQRVVFSTIAPKATILKHDPFLSLYLIEDKKGFKHPFKINYKLSLGVAALNEKEVIEGEILKQQLGLNSFATFSEPVLAPALLLTSCCSLEGIVTPNGIIEKEYIDRFIQADKVSYSDIGIRVEDKNNLVVVNAINPFLKDNPFRIYDFIIELNGKKPKSASSFMREILFSTIGSVHKIKVKRGTKVLLLKVKSKKRYGGGYLSDIYLKFSGLSFDENLRLVNIEQKAQKYGLKIGDTLLEINQKKISNEEDIIRMISQKKNAINLLFARDGFQFFIRIN